jgi:type VI secretion system secreted protein VgrG
MGVASHSVITFEIPPLDKETFLVRAFEGHEALSRPFRFEVQTLVLDKPLDPEKVLGKTANLTIKGDGFEVVRHGIVTSMEQTPDGGSVEKCFCNLVIEPKFLLTQYTQQSRIFQDLTVLEIAEEVFKGCGMSSTDWKKEIKDAPPKREFTVQYQETDFNFVSRLLEDEGIFYFFDHSGKTEVLVLADNPDAVKAPPAKGKLALIPDSGQARQEGDHVLTFRRTDKLVTSKVTVKDYNYRTPDSPIEGSDSAKGPGELYIYGAHTKYVDDATRMAKIRHQMLAAEKTLFFGTSNARAMMPGFKINLTDTTQQGFDGEYSVLRISHRGLLGSDDNNPSVEFYNNEFELIPATTPYRPELTTPKPKIQGILPALVDGQEGQYAFIDEAGRYKAKFFFDRSDKKEGNASKAIRMAQPYSGANYGMHFPLHTGTEIALGFADGDPDRPIGLGSVPNPMKGSPVKAGNKSQNVMKSASGNGVCLEDKDGGTGVHINSSGGHKISLDDSGGTKGISGSTSGGYSINLDDTKKNVTIKTSGGHVLVLDDQGQKVSVTTTSGHTITLDDAGNKIHIADGGGNTSVDMDGGAGDVKISATNNITLHADGNLILEATGDCTIDAKNITASAKAQFAGNAKTGLSLDGGTELNGKALNVSVNADVGLTLGGTTVESTGKASNKVAAAMVEIAGQAMTNITGGTIKLN